MQLLQMTNTAVFENKELTELRKEALKIIAYFSVFNYPLSVSEINKFIRVPVPENELRIILKEEIEKGILITNGTYIGIGEPSQFENRTAGNLLFEQDWKKAQRYIRIISRAPYVRGVLVTGSMSKGYNYRGGDVDFLVITQPGRLWICRTLLVLYKKLFLLNSRKYFCINYFISSGKLEIEDKNMFTAVEISTAIPVYNTKYTDAFFETNAWVKNHLNSDGKLVEASAFTVGKENFKKATEFIFDNRVGNGIDQFCRKIHMRYWKWKYRKLPQNEVKNNIKNARDVSKYHPGSFRTKVLQAYEQKLHELQLVK